MKNLKIEKRVLSRGPWDETRRRGKGAVAEILAREATAPFPRRLAKPIFVTGTDTGVGKTMVTGILGVLLQSKGINVGVMKPVQCAGHDAQYLKDLLNIPDPLEVINPCFAPQPLSPHLAFACPKKQVDIPKILQAFHTLQNRYDVLLIEGAGGLLVPLKENYWVIDLIKELGASVLIVSRTGLGTINHTLLTIHQVRQAGLEMEGIIFNASGPGPLGIPERTNPEAIERFGRVPILGQIAYLASDIKKDRQKILVRCKDKINLKKILYRPQDESSYLWETRDKKYLWHPFTQMKDWLEDPPLVIEEAKGCLLKDTQGHWYIDGVSSLWVNVHGHRKKQIDEALYRQIERLSHSTFLGLSNTGAIELAQKLIEIAPKGLEKVFYSDNGSTAVEVALKMAYQYWQNIGKRGKVKIAHLTNSYHGDTLGSVSVGGIDLFHRVYSKLIFETVRVEFPDFYRTPKRKKYPQYTEECLKRLENLFRKEKDSIAALIIEPLVQGAAGMIVWPVGLLKRIAQLCRRNNIFLIADEVATGFGRTGKMFACDHEGVTPDFLCLAKGLTGGYLPLAATLTTKKIFEGFLFDYKEQKTFFHGHTYTGNPLACAAAIANLEIFEKERVLYHLRPKIKYLARGLKKFYNLASVGDIRQMGFMVGIELVKDRKSKEPYCWQEKIGIRVCQEARNFGVILRPLGNVIVLMPPLAISLDELDQLVEATYAAMETICS